MELLAVVIVLAGLATVTVDVLQTDTNQARFDDTRERLGDLRRAVIGAPERTVNGAPMITGFAADMGRLPANLRELVDPDGRPAWTVDADTGLGHGWRGPYLSVFHEAISEEPAFRDGWGNDLDVGEADGFGWKRFAVVTDDLIAQSFGADGAANPADVATYNAQAVFSQDYPPPPSPGTDPTADPAALVRAAEYQVGISPLRIRFRNRTGGIYPVTALTVCLRIFYPDNGAQGQAGSAAVTLNPIAAGEDSPTIEFDTFRETATSPEVEEVTWGVRTLRLVEHDGDCDAANTVVPNTGEYKQLVFMPPAMLADIDWVLSP